MRIIGTITGLAVAIALTACGNSSTPAPTDEPNNQATADETGTRDNPYAPGDTINLGDWTITLAATNLDATQEVIDATQTNNIEDGHTAIMVDVTATYTGDDSATVWTDIGINFVGRDGNTYNSANAYCGPIDGSLLQAREQYTNATVTGTMCVTIPPEATGSGGAWKIEPRFDRGAVFVAVE